MAKLTQKEINQQLEEEQHLEEYLFYLEESKFIDKEEDFTLIETAIHKLPKEVKIKHQWIND